MGQNRESEGDASMTPFQSMTGMTARQYDRQEQERGAPVDLEELAQGLGLDFDDLKRAYLDERGEPDEAF
jgi:hypothetical protein